MRAALAAVAVAAVLATSSPASGQPAEDRIGGQNRYDTAALVSEVIDFCAVAVANGQSFPDGLAGAVFGWPVLLTEPDALPDETIAELTRLANACPSQSLQIFVLGGKAAVSGDVFEELAGFTDNVGRLDGANRYETAIAIAEKFDDTVGIKDDTVLLATGEDFPDALAAGPLAATWNYPIILNDGDSLRPEVLGFLADRNIQEVVILGGSAAVPGAIEDQLQLQPLPITPTRLAGADRAATAVAIAAEVRMGKETECAVIVNGQAFPDALAAGPFGHRFSCPIALVSRDSLPGATVDWLVNHSTTLQAVTAIGGTAVISDPTLAAAIAAASP